MRAVIIERFGGPDGMVVTEASLPDAAALEVVVTTEAIGVGGVDAVIRRGTLGGYGFETGLIPGSEVAGTVSAVGEGVDASWLGRRVWAFTGTSGGYAEQVRASVANIVALPEGLSPVEAVTIGSAGVVAHFALRQAHLAAGESVLVRGGSGSIGLAAIELAARAGAGEVAVTTSAAADSERAGRLRELGAGRILNRDGVDLDNGSATREFDVIVDVVAGAGMPGFIDRLASNGRLMVVGIVGGPPPADFGLRLMAAFQRSRSFGTFSLDTVPVASRDAVRASQFGEVAQGNLHAVVDEVLPLADAVEAHRRMDSGEVFGRIVLVP